MKLEELWDVLMLPAKDMDTNEPIEGETLMKNRKKEVLFVSCDAHFNILIRYDKGDEND